MFIHFKKIAVFRAYKVMLNKKKLKKVLHFHQTQTAIFRGFEMKTNNHPKGQDFKNVTHSKPIRTCNKCICSIPLHLGENKQHWANTLQLNLLYIMTFTVSTNDSSYSS